jgi:hypothetical protein
LNLIINIFPDPQEQANAIGAFGANGTIGNSQYPCCELGPSDANHQTSCRPVHRRDVRSMGVLALGVQADRMRDHTSLCRVLFLDTWVSSSECRSAADNKREDPNFGPAGRIDTDE